MNLFADRYTQLDVFGFSFPSSWFQSVQPIFVIIARTGVCMAVGSAWAAHEPSVPAKFALGLLFMGIAFLVLVPAGAMAQSAKAFASVPWWLVASYRISELGELCLYPVGLSAVTKLSPARIVGLMMGVWFLSQRVRQQTGRMGRRLLQHDAAAARFSLTSPPCWLLRRGSHVCSRQANQQADGRSPLTVALEKYRAKRNFNETPEPAGDAKVAAERARKAKGAAPRFFCVQKHLASHLHYDFRLEHNGVLLSWAVPKGPSLDPSTKRLAMIVEDHPIDTATFEGVIPSGYGAGIVMLWDRGTWTPEVDDVEAALKKGDLKFTLDGYKLKGSWVLVRTKGKWGGPAAATGRGC